MHPLGQQNGYGGYGLEGAGQQQPTSPHTNGTEADEGSKYSDINSILDQILNITDQSLDEAQVLYYLSYELQQDCLVLAIMNYRSSTLFLLMPLLRPLLCQIDIFFDKIMPNSLKPTKM